MECQIFPKYKIFIKSIQKSVNLSPSNGLLVFVPKAAQSELLKQLTELLYLYFYKAAHF